MSIVLVSATVIAQTAKTFEGKPAIKAGSITGAFIWKDNKGIHVRFTAKGKEQSFNGRVYLTKGKIDSVRPVMLEKGDTVKKNSSGNSIIFNLNNKKNIDGFDFSTKSKSITFSIKVNGGKLNSRNIMLGKNSSRPKSNPFIMYL
jgi:hypothetical protein